MPKLTATNSLKSIKLEFQISQDLYRRINKAAKKLTQKKNELCRTAIINYLNNHDIYLD